MATERPEGVTLTATPKDDGWRPVDPLTYEIEIKSGQGDLGTRSATLKFKLVTGVDGLNLATDTCKVVK